VPDIPRVTLSRQRPVGLLPNQRGDLGVMAARKTVTPAFDGHEPGPVPERRSFGSTGLALDSHGVVGSNRPAVRYLGMAMLGYGRQGP